MFQTLLLQTHAKSTSIYTLRVLQLIRHALMLGDLNARNQPNAF